MGAFSSPIFWGVLRLFVWIQRLIDMFWWMNQKGLSLVTLSPCLTSLANAISPPSMAAPTSSWELLCSPSWAPPWLKTDFFLKLMSLCDPIWGIGIAKSLTSKTRLKRWTIWKECKFAILFQWCYSSFLCFHSFFPPVFLFRWLSAHLWSRLQESSPVRYRNLSSRSSSSSFSAPSRSPSIFLAQTTAKEFR